jgi:hypothetical protein
MLLHWANGFLLFEGTLPLIFNGREVHPLVEILTLEDKAQV